MPVVAAERDQSADGVLPVRGRGAGSVDAAVDGDERLLALDHSAARHRPVPRPVRLALQARRAAQAEAPRALEDCPGGVQLRQNEVRVLEVDRRALDGAAAGRRRGPIA